MERYEANPCRISCKTGARADVRNEIFAIGFETLIMGTELYKEKQEFQIRKTKPLLYL